MVEKTSNLREDSKQEKVEKHDNVDENNGNEESPVNFSVTEYTDRFFSFLENIDEAFFVLNANSREILRVNPAASKLTGYTQQELLTQKIDNLHPQEEIALLILEIQRLEFERQTGIEDFTLIQKNGWKFPVDIQLSRLVVEEEDFFHHYVLAIYRGEAKGDWEDAFSKRNQELLALMEVGITTNLVIADYLKTARKIDYCCRFIFPAAFIAWGVWTLIL